MKIQDFKAKKQAQQKISMVTCYDYPSACIVAQSQIDSILVGDSVAMAMYGHHTTIMATPEMLLLHTQAVARGIGKQFLIADIPFLSHKKSQKDTIDQVTALLQAGAHAVKIEGADADTCQTIRYLVNAGIPVMGHIGLTAQFIHQFGGFKVQGKTPKQAEHLLQQALDLEASGCFAVVIECVPSSVAQTITQQLTIPSIGIGAGPATDGQILVWHDLLGLHDFKPKFVKRYAEGKTFFLDALDRYVEEIQAQHFPELEEVF
jgi:3-methyl-2-oxobutanoate hydroxymethyltransferase